jgi:hypothetical protein
MAAEITPALDFVPVRFSDHDTIDKRVIKKRKLRFRHKDIRDAIKESEQGIASLLTDIFIGWPYLLRYGLRHEDMGMTIDRASELLDAWVREPDPDTKEPRTIDQLGKKLLDAINASGFIKIQSETPPDKDSPEGDDSGND